MLRRNFLKLVGISPIAAIDTDVARDSSKPTLTKLVGVTTDDGRFVPAQPLVDLLTEYPGISKAFMDSKVPMLVAGGLVLFRNECSKEEFNKYILLIEIFGWNNLSG